MTENNPIIEQLLSYQQAGQILGVSARTIWSLVDSGDLPVVRFGRSVRVDPADLRAFIEKAKAGQGSRHA